MAVPQLILDTLDELGSEEFKLFLWNLSQPVVDGCAPIRKSRLENANRQDIVSKMMESYGDEMAVNVAVEILKRIGYNRAAAMLKEKFAGGSSAPHNPSPAPSSSSTSSSSSSSSLAPAPAAAGSSVCAQGKSVIVAPNITGTSSGVSINMNINTQ